MLDVSIFVHLHKRCKDWDICRWVTEMAVTDKLSRTVDPLEISSRKAYQLSFYLKNFSGPSFPASSIVLSYMDLPFYCSSSPMVFSSQFIV